MSVTEKILLVLDIDETLVHSISSVITEKLLPNSPIKPNYTAHSINIFLRPGVHEFLSECAKHFELALWSSGGTEYVQYIANVVFRQHTFKFVWDIRRCTSYIPANRRQELGYFDQFTPFNPYDSNVVDIKQLRKVSKAFKIPLAKILIVDDTPAKSIKNYGNAIYIRPFNISSIIRGDDNELEKLLKYLITLKNVDNVRYIEKRYWYEEIL